MTRHHHHHHSSRSHGGSSSQGSGSGGSSSNSGKSSDTYGCWSGIPTSYTAQTLEQDRSPHLTLNFAANSSSSSSSSFSAQINVASTSSETSLVYWLHRNWSHPLTSTLASLSQGFNPASTTDGTGLSLDFIRTTPAILDFSQGQIVQDSSRDSGTITNNILSDLEPLIQSAIDAKATVYVFGRDYQTGIDDVHMNQGNTGDYENAVGVDGGIVFQYAATDGHWDAVFLAFAEQEIPTDDETGRPTGGAKPLSTIATAGGAGSSAQ